MKINWSAVLVVVLSLLIPLIVRGADRLDFSLRIDDGVITSESLAGQVVYIDFWASWCVPCQKSFPWMNEMQAKYLDQGFKIIAINLDKEKAPALAFLKSLPANFTIAYDPEGQLAEKFGVVGMPMAFLLNQQGEVVDRHVGFKTSKIPVYERSIKDLIGMTD